MDFQKLTIVLHVEGPSLSNWPHQWSSFTLVVHIGPHHSDVIIFRAASEWMVQKHDNIQLVRSVTFFYVSSTV